MLQVSLQAYVPLTIQEMHSTGVLAMDATFRPSSSSSRGDFSPLSRSRGGALWNSIEWWLDLWTETLSKLGTRSSETGAREGATFTSPLSSRLWGCGRLATGVSSDDSDDLALEPSESSDLSTRNDPY
jgi:hypothetical protein